MSRKIGTDRAGGRPGRAAAGGARAAVAATGALALLGLSCGGETTAPAEPPAAATAPDPGFVKLRLSTPRGDDGAVQLTVSGGAADSISHESFTVFSADLGDGTHRILVLGDLGEGRIARFWVPDRRRLGEYRVRLDQVAARATYENRNPESYGLTLEPEAE